MPLASVMHYFTVSRKNDTKSFNFEDAIMNDRMYVCPLFRLNFAHLAESSFAYLMWNFVSFVPCSVII